MKRTLSSCAIVLGLLIIGCHKLPTGPSDPCAPPPTSPDVTVDATCKSPPK